jgi:hypothetical protein
MKYLITLLMLLIILSNCNKSTRGDLSRVTIQETSKTPHPTNNTIKYGFKVKFEEPVKNLSQSDALLMIQNAITGEYDERVFRLAVCPDDPNALRTVAGIEFKEDELSNYLFLVKFIDRDGGSFYSRHIRLYDIKTEKFVHVALPDTNNVGILHLEICRDAGIIPFVNFITDSSELIDPSKPFFVYKLENFLGLNQKIVQFESARFRKTIGELQLVSLLDLIAANISTSRFACNNELLFLFRGTASELDLDLTKVVDKADLQNFEYLNLAGESVEYESITEEGIKYKNGVMPILRAAEVTNAARQAMEGLYPNIRDRTFAINSSVEGQDIPEKRRVDIYLIVQPKSNAN